MLGRVQPAMQGRSRGGVMNTMRRGRATAHVQSSANNGRGRSGALRWAAGLTVVVVLAIGLPAASAVSQDNAAEEMHEVSWLHSSPTQVRGFILYVSPVSGSLADARQIDVGKPSGTTSSGPQIFSAMVSIGADEFVAVAAIGQNGLQGALSAWQQALGC